MIEFESLEVASLKHRIAELTRENKYLRAASGQLDRPVVEQIANMPVNCLPELQLAKAAAWSVKRSREFGQLHVMGRTFGGVRGEDYLVQYFMENPNLLEPRDRISLLQHCMTQLHRIMLADWMKAE